MDIGDRVNNSALMKVWLDNCRDNHVDCFDNPEHFVPTRLLDLEAFAGSKNIRLVTVEPRNFSHEHPPKYVALSHCWGPPSKHPLSTTKATLSKHQTRIPFSELSLTFQDAVQVTRALKQTFLWIGSLCIIQGDEEDWANEAALMTQVYGCSYVTLAALSSKDSSEGCRTTNDPQSSYGNRFVDIDFNTESEERTQSQRVRIFEYNVADSLEIISYDKPLDTLIFQGTPVGTGL